MDSQSRTAVTMTVLFLITLLMAVWGWFAFTEPFPEKPTSTSDEPPTCRNRTLQAGDTITANDVVVSVFNASSNSGLAGRTLVKLQRAGFVAGDMGNVDRKLKFRGDAAVLTDDPKSPVAQLVSSYLDAKPVRFDGRPMGAGVVVVVKDDLRKRLKGEKSMKLDEPLTFCAAL